MRFTMQNCTFASLATSSPSQQVVFVFTLFRVVQRRLVNQSNAFRVPLGAIMAPLCVSFINARPRLMYDKALGLEKNSYYYVEWLR